MRPSPPRTRRPLAEAPLHPHRHSRKPSRFLGRGPYGGIRLTRGRHESRFRRRPCACSDARARKCRRQATNFHKRGVIVCIDRRHRIGDLLARGRFAPVTERGEVGPAEVIARGQIRPSFPPSRRTPTGYGRLLATQLATHQDRSRHEGEVAEGIAGQRGRLVWCDASGVQMNPLASPRICPGQSAYAREIVAQS